MVEIKEQFYLLRNTYLKIQDFNKSLLLDRIDLNRMIWSKDIYSNNIENLIEIKKTESWTLYELEYKGYRLFFISETNTTKRLTNIFWVNTLVLETKYEKYRNESIIGYGSEGLDGDFKVNINNKHFNVAYTGNSFISYCSKRKYKTSNKVKYFFQTEATKYLNGSSTEYKFKSSIFNNNIIIYGHDI